MRRCPQTRSQTVETRGAAAGCVLCGTGLNNQGVRIRVLCEQQKGHHGSIRGTFVLLDAGDNKHTDALRPLLGRETNAEEVLRVIRRDSPGCVSVGQRQHPGPGSRPPRGDSVKTGPRRDGAGRQNAPPLGGAVPSTNDLDAR
jgi:hypothetical protein